MFNYDLSVVVVVIGTFFTLCVMFFLSWISFFSSSGCCAVTLSFFSRRWYKSRLLRVVFMGQLQIKCLIAGAIADAVLVWLDHTLSGEGSSGTLASEKNTCFLELFRCCLEMSPKCFRENRDLLRSCFSADFGHTKPENTEQDRSTRFAKTEIVLMLLKLLAKRKL